MRLKVEIDGAVLIIIRGFKTLCGEYKLILQFTNFLGEMIKHLSVLKIMGIVNFYPPVLTGRIPQNFRK